MTVPEITSETEKGLHDFVFAIRGSDKLSDGSRRIRAMGTAKNRQVEFDYGLDIPSKSASGIHGCGDQIFCYFPRR